MSMAASRVLTVGRLGMPIVARRASRVARIPLKLLVWSCASASMSRASMPSATTTDAEASAYFRRKYWGVWLSRPVSITPSHPSRGCPPVPAGPGASMKGSPAPPSRFGDRPEPLVGVRPDGILKRERALGVLGHVLEFRGHIDHRCGGLIEPAQVYQGPGASHDREVGDGAVVSRQAGLRQGGVELDQGAFEHGRIGLRGAEDSAVADHMAEGHAVAEGLAEVDIRQPGNALHLGDLRALVRGDQVLLKRARPPFPPRRGPCGG